MSETIRQKFVAISEGLWGLLDRCEPNNFEHISKQRSQLEDLQREVNKELQDRRAMADIVDACISTQPNN